MTIPENPRSRASTPDLSTTDVGSDRDGLAARQNHVRSDLIAGQTIAARPLASGAIEGNDPLADFHPPNDLSFPFISAHRQFLIDQTASIAPNWRRLTVKRRRRRESWPRLRQL
jgi:hypothetical protein